MEEVCSGDLHPLVYASKGRVCELDWVYTHMDTLESSSAYNTTNHIVWCENYVIFFLFVLIESTISHNMYFSNSYRQWNTMLYDTQKVF